MFISRTTREERVTIETALDSAFLKIDQAEQLIYDLIDAFLSDREQKTLDKHAAQTIRNNLWIADDLLADAQLEYHLHAGHGDAPCVQQYLESAARAKANVEDEEVHNCELKAQHHDQQAGLGHAAVPAGAQHLRDCPAARRDKEQCPLLTRRGQRQEAQVNVPVSKAPHGLSLQRQLLHLSAPGLRDSVSSGSQPSAGRLCV